MKIDHFDAIIFDLGGVLINLNYKDTTNAFIELGLTDFDAMYSKANQEGLFDQFEVGKISPFLFINKLLTHLPKGTTANQVVHAWNAMIKDFPVNRLELLESLSKSHNLILYSNTNAIHEEKVRRELKKVSSGELETYFTNTYLSHLFGHRKPRKESFQRLMENSNLDPTKTLFIDDSHQHIIGAREAGLTAIHLTGELLDHPIFS